MVNLEGREAYGAVFKDAPSRPEQIGASLNKNLICRNLAPVLSAAGTDHFVQRSELAQRVSILLNEFGA